MSFPYGPEDVRRHLENLGYEHITETQLAEFIKDLKRLIRYEEKQSRLQEHLGVLENAKSSPAPRRSRRRRRSHSTSSSSAYSSSSSQWDEEEKPVPARYQTRKVLTDQSTQASSSSSPRVRETSFSASMSSSSASQVTSEAHYSRSATSTTTSSESHLLVQIKIPDRSRSMSSPRCPEDEPDRPRRLLPGKTLNKPTTSFIRPPLKGPVTKKLNCDPVRLHQQYKAYWDKMKIPGDNSSKPVRWAVREWMMGHRE